MYLTGLSLLIKVKPSALSEISLLILSSEYAVIEVTFDLIAVMLVFPSTISLSPVPIAPSPITIWFKAVAEDASALFPIITFQT